MNIEIPAPPPAQPTRWRRALSEFRTLIANPADTDRAIHFVYAFGMREFERNFQRFAASQGGHALLAERPSLLAALSDCASLARLPDGSFGRAYLFYLESKVSHPTDYSRSKPACKHTGSAKRASRR